MENLYPDKIRLWLDSVVSAGLRLSRRGGEIYFGVVGSGSRSLWETGQPKSHVWNRGQAHDRRAQTACSLLEGGVAFELVELHEKVPGKLEMIASSSRRATVDEMKKLLDEMRAEDNE